jgi:hypothetical protein
MFRNYHNFYHKQAKTKMAILVREPIDTDRLEEEIRLLVESADENPEDWVYLGAYPEKYFIDATGEGVSKSNHVIAMVEKYPGLNIFKKIRQIESFENITPDRQLPVDAFETKLSKAGYAQADFGYNHSLGFTKQQLLEIAEKMDDLDVLRIAAIDQ